VGTHGERRRPAGTSQTRATRRHQERPGTGQEALRVTVKEMEEEIQEYLSYQAPVEPQANRTQPPRQGGNYYRWKPATMLAKWTDLEL
jgi:hypothetical protein